MKVCFRTKTLSLDLKFIFAGVQAIIFVVDSNDIQRLEVAKKELHKVMQEEALKEAVLLVLANKQDLKMAASVATVADTLGLRSLENRKWSVFIFVFYVQSHAKPSEGLFRAPAPLQEMGFQVGWLGWLGNWMKQINGKG